MVKALWTCNYLGEENKIMAALINGMTIWDIYCNVQCVHAANESESWRDRLVATVAYVVKKKQYTVWFVDQLHDWREGTFSALSDVQTPIALGQLISI